MRIFPRIQLPSMRSLARRLRRWRQRLTVARAVVIAQSLLIAAALLFLFTGSRAAMLDRAGARADAVIAAAILALFVWLHRLARRRIIPALERRFYPSPYDERRILLDLSQEVPAATNLDQLYRSIIRRIGEALETRDVCIFVRDDASGNYYCRAASADIHAGASNQPALALWKDAFIVRRLRNLSQPLALDAAELELWARALNAAPSDTREARAHEGRILQRINANLLVQIRIKDRLAGILSLGLRRGKHQYSSADKEMLLSVAGQLALVIENAKLAERMVAEERLRRELALAAEVQQRLFPTDPPPSSRLEMSGFCQPARGVGGDYYDFLEFGNEQIGIAIADVAGKGISAALLMSSLQASLRSQAIAHNCDSQADNSLSEMVSNLNHLLCRSTRGATYVTFFYAQFDERTKRLTYVNAGHNPPMLLRSAEVAAVSAIADKDAGDCFKLTEGGPVIGIFDDCHYEQESLQLQSGDLLVAYTDGVTEALNDAGEEFGEERLQHIVAAAAHLTAREVRDAVVQQVKSWCANVPQHDDLTFIVLKMK